MVLETVTPGTWTDANEIEAGKGEGAGAGHRVHTGGGGLAPGASHPGGRDTEEEDFEDINTRAHKKTYLGLLVTLSNQVAIARLFVVDDPSKEFHTHKCSTST